MQRERICLCGTSGTHLLPRVLFNPAIFRRTAKAAMSGGGCSFPPLDQQGAHVDNSSLQVPPADHFITSDHGALLINYSSVVVCRDLNCKYPAWNSRVDNPKGRIIESSPMRADCVSYYYRTQHMERTGISPL
ncbi:hypothetical protein Zmor_012329 [Zophobas morio]|jgi:hypothetical protein|uniref:Uncharacterized protein n=1 Tax=Zophobas morio TaxID=2755281 RepID=A0AA38HIF3_9CUCU|nr:hypothetical protein Zmor_012329 [Zophobas morio]